MWRYEWLCAAPSWAAPGFGHLRVLSLLSVECPYTRRAQDDAGLFVFRGSVWRTISRLGLCPVVVERLDRTGNSLGKLRIAKRSNRIDWRHPRRGVSGPASTDWPVLVQTH